MENENDDSIAVILKWTLLATAVLTFAVIGWGAYRAYHDTPPQPRAISSESGTLIMTSDDIVAGKAAFQRADLMDFGSLYGMGSSFGPDYTAQYLKELAIGLRENISEKKYGQNYDNLDDDQKMIATRGMQVYLQSIDLTQPELVLSNEASNAIASLQNSIAEHMMTTEPQNGWVAPKTLTNESATKLADFLIYSSLTTVARRPGMDVSWTQNWPFEPIVGNTPSTSTFIWTWAGFCLTFFGFGLVIFIYERYLVHPHEETGERKFDEFMPLTKSQRKTAKYFLVVAAVLLVQIGAGGLMAHYYSDRASFYGIDISKWLPFNFLRTVHIQTPIVWIGVSWIAAALFLAPAISGKEAKNQGALVDILFWATILVVAGGLIGDYLGIQNLLGEGDTWFWVGNQGLSYIELGRVWQIGFFGGLVIWSVLVFRALWPSYDSAKDTIARIFKGKIRIEHLLWVATANIALLYACGMVPLTGIEKSFSISDFWRWWVVHLWVEQSFEFFAVVISAYLLMQTGLVSRRMAERAAYFELILIFLGGVIGTGHHFYWTGQSPMWIPLGSMFSFIEVLPLALLVTESLEQKRIISAHGEFKYKLAYLYILGAAFWNFVGAGVFGGGTLNAPLVNYYEHGTFLTLNHAHTALFGAFGLLALGLVYFCLRYAAGTKYAFNERLGTWAFWLYNSGLVLWIALNFFPIGWPQLAAVYEHGLAYARSTEFYDTTTFWQWMRFPGDIAFALGALIMAFDFIKKSKPFFAKDN